MKNKDNNSKISELRGETEKLIQKIQSKNDKDFLGINTSKLIQALEIVNTELENQFAEQKKVNSSNQHQSEKDVDLFDFVSKGNSADATQRKITETELQEYKKKLEEKISDFDLLSNTTTALLEIDSKEEIYNFLGKSLYHVSGADYIILTEFHRHTNTLCVNQIVGIESFAEKIKKFLGRDIKQFSIPIKDLIEQKELAQRRKIYEVTGGFYTLTANKLPKPISKSIEKLLGIEKIFSAGFLWEGKYFGAVTFCYKKGKYLQRSDLLESIINQTALAFSRRFFEDSLIDSEAKYRSIFENTGTATLIVDENSKIQMVNEECLLLTGFSREQLLGNSWMNYITPESLELVNKNQLLQKQNPTLAPNKFEVNLVVAKGEIKIAHLNIGLIPSIKFTVVSIQDITEQKFIQNKIKKSEEFFREITNNSSDINLVINKLGFINYISSSVERILGYQPKELIGQKIFRFIHTSDIKRAAIDFGKAIPTKNSSVYNSFRVLHKDGTERILEGYGKNLFQNPIISGYIMNVHDITEKKKIEESLIKSKNEYKTLVDKGNVGIGIDDEHGKLIYCNKQFLKLFGYSGSESQNKTHKDFVHPDDFERVSEIHNKRIIGESKSSRYEFKGIRKDGSVIFIEIDVSEIFEDNGKLTGTLSYLWDITQRKAYEESLLKLSSAVEQSPASILITNTAGDIEYVNPKVTEITGYQLPELIGQNPRIFNSGERPVSEYRELWSTISSGNLWYGEFHNKKKNGEFYWESASISPIKNENGIITHYLAVKEDISDKIRLQSTQEILVKISNAVLATDSFDQFCHVIFSEIVKIIDTNNLFIALYEEHSSMISVPYIMDKVDKNLTQYPAQNTLTGKVIQSKKPLLINKSDFLEQIEKGVYKLMGPLFEVWIGVPLIINKKAVGTIVIQNYFGERNLNEQDLDLLESVAPQISLALERKKTIENLKITKDKAEESDKLKSAFLANMSHEIRTPMNGILGFTELLLEPELSSEEKERYIEIVHKSGQRMLDTVTDIIEISKIEAGIITKHFQETNVEKQVEELILFFQPEAKNKGLKLTFNKVPQNSGITIIVDQNKLNSILTNLIKNAIKYTYLGAISVGFCRKGSVLEFYVKDSGIGVSLNRQKAIFNRFEQADIGDRRAFEGSGLGLAIVKSYLEMLNGKIWLESIPGKGSTFYFTLPFEQKKNKESENKIESISANKITHVEGLKILITDDDEISIAFLKTILTKISIKILVAKNGIEAVNMCQNNPDIELILMDIKMPQMNGYEATQKIRKFNKNVIIIAQTGYALSGDHEKALAAGCNDYISKPIKKDKLLALITTNLNR